MRKKPTDNQETERPVEGVWTAVFKCKRCRYRNRPARTRLDLVKMYLCGQLPPCRNCGKTFHLIRSTIPASLLRQAEEEIERERGVIRCANPDCRKKLKLPIAPARGKLRCPACEMLTRFP